MILLFPTTWHPRLCRSSNDFEALRVENRRHDLSPSLFLLLHEKRFSLLQATFSSHRASNRKQIRSRVLSPYISRHRALFFFPSLSLVPSFLPLPPMHGRRIGKFKCALGHETKRSRQVAREYARDRERVRTHAHARVKILPPSLSFQRPREACARL